ncbi:MULTISPECIES: TetR/AcrR family transcriptional regulator [Amycolatopsis]|uniref:TetR family transcriptional regulator n=1 Tax=Amycolatopsis bullii TaxID=941987 RepID=A0ABQ3KV21_9PSEU|nr:TetR family transcriptional regulator [Amycolatopsis bullii]GHG48303.1 TetR family transcriptional regulator [Amycolatopsis bullii]
MHQSLGGRHPQQLSPNQAEKRAKIVEAAKTVLAENGLTGCTARAVAAASPLTKSAIHYYFADMDELVDQAMAAHIAAFVHAIRQAVAQHTDVTERFWSAVAEYLKIFNDAPRTIVLWHEYWLHSVRSGRLEAIDAMTRDVTGIFHDLLRAINVEEPGLRARMLTSYLIGAATRQAVTDRPFSVVQEEITLLCPLG